jgi:hypothetical protein
LIRELRQLSQELRMLVRELKKWRSSKKPKQKNT